MEEETKRCLKCGRVLPLTEFHRNRRSKDGRRTYCKDCTREMNNANYARRKERMVAYQPVPQSESELLNQLSGQYVRIRFKEGDTVIHLERDKFLLATLTGAALVVPDENGYKVEYEDEEGNYIPAEHLYKTKREAIEKLKLASIPEDRLTYGNKSSK